MEAFEKQFDIVVRNTLEVLVEKLKEEGIKVDKKISSCIEESYNDIVTSANYTLYKNNNFTKGKSTQKSTKKKEKDSICWYRHPHDSNYSYTDSITNEEGYYFLRKNENQKVIATLNNEGLVELTPNDIKILISYHLKYDNIRI